MALRIWSMAALMARTLPAARFRDHPQVPTLTGISHGRDPTVVPPEKEHLMSGSVILAGARTPIGKLSGAFAGFSAAELGGFAIKAALERAGVAPDQVDYVHMGHVLQAGAGQITARQAAANGGIGMEVPATTVNKVCLSGMNAIHLAHQMIALGEAEIVVAGGMESMTNAPYLLPGARSGYRYGDSTVVDSLVQDGLFCAFDQCAMGAGTEKYAASESISRDEQDAFAAASHQRAAAGAKDGLFDQEIVPVEVPQRRGDPLVVSDDEGVRADTTGDSLGKLRPAFDKAGNITAGNASQISDGGSAMVITSKEVADRLGVAPLAEIVGYGQVAGPDPSLLHQPARAIRAALDRAGKQVSDIDLFELNEAFAAVGIASMRELGITDEITNVNGGAIAVGHPLGMSGNRIALHVANEMKRRGGGLAAAGLCGGGGQGDAILLQVAG
jgi:acetyl-CoA C-acetyltransferase